MDEKGRKVADSRRSQSPPASEDFGSRSPKPLDAPIDPTRRTREPVRANLSQRLEVVDESVRSPKTIRDTTPTGIHDDKEKLSPNTTYDPYSSPERELLSQFANDVVIQQRWPYELSDLYTSPFEKASYQIFAAGSSTNQDASRSDEKTNIPPSRKDVLRDFMEDPNTYHERIRKLQDRVHNAWQIIGFSGRRGGAILDDFELTGFVDTKNVRLTLSHDLRLVILNFKSLLRCLNELVAEEFSEPNSATIVDIAEAAHDELLALEWRSPSVDVASYFATVEDVEEAATTMFKYLGLPLPVPSSSVIQSPTGIQMMSILVRFLFLGLISYASSHTGSFDVELIGKERDCICISSKLEEYAFRRRDLACLSRFVGKQVWVLESSPASVNKDHNSTLVLPRLYLATKLDDFAELWGPVEIIFEDPEEKNISELIVNGGTIRGVRKIHFADHQTVQDASNPSYTLCHYQSWKRSDQAERPASSFTFQREDVLLIGAPQFSRNKQCTFRPERSSDHLLGSRKKAWKLENRNLNLTFAKFVGFSLGRTWKLHPNLTKKDVIVSEWGSRGSETDKYPYPKYLDQNVGIEVSHCTQNARRVKLWELFRNNDVIDYVRCTFPPPSSISPEEWPTKYQEAFDKHKSFTELWNSQIDWKPYLREILGSIISKLQHTGVDQDGVLCIWDASNGFLVRSDFNWKGMARDSEHCASFVVFTTDCLEYTKGRICFTKKTRQKKAQDALPVILTKLSLFEEPSKPVHYTLLTRPRARESFVESRSRSGRPIGRRFQSEIAEAPKSGHPIRLSGYLSGYPGPYHSSLTEPSQDTGKQPVTLEEKLDKIRSRKMAAVKVREDAANHNSEASLHPQELDADWSYKRTKKGKAVDYNDQNTESIQYSSIDFDAKSFLHLGEREPNSPTHTKRIMVIEATKTADTICLEKPHGYLRVAEEWFRQRIYPQRSFRDTPVRCRWCGETWFGLVHTGLSEHFDLPRLGQPVKQMRFRESISSNADEDKNLAGYSFHICVE